jgi:hypothetical protein
LSDSEPIEAPMVGFAELVIGPATSGRTRWLNPRYKCDESHRLPRAPQSTNRDREISFAALPRFFLRHAAENVIRRSGPNQRIIAPEAICCRRRKGDWLVAATKPGKV